MATNKQTGRWTAEARAKQAEAIRGWAPWEKSTGPQSIEGRYMSSRNAFSGGLWREMQELARALKRSRATVEDVRARAWQVYDGATRK